MVPLLENIAEYTTMPASKGSTQAMPLPLPCFIALTAFSAPEMKMDTTIATAYKDLKLVSLVIKASFWKEL